MSNIKSMDSEGQALYTRKPTIKSSGKTIASVMDKKMDRAIFSFRSFLTTESVFVNRFALSTGSLICS